MTRHSAEEEPFTHAELFAALHEAEMPVETQQVVLGALDRWRAANEAEDLNAAPYAQDVAEGFAQFLLAETSEARELARTAAVTHCEEYLVGRAGAYRKLTPFGRIAQGAALVGYAFLGTLRYGDSVDLGVIERAGVTEEYVLQLLRARFCEVNPHILPDMIEADLLSINPNEDGTDLAGYMRHNETVAVVFPYYAELARGLSAKGFAVTEVDPERIQTTIDRSAQPLFGALPRDPDGVWRP
jgi:hypothetical protein